MKEYKYAVTLETFFRNKTGTMILNVAEGENNVEGVLKIMEHENPFHGHISGEDCHISGSLKTLVNTVHYEADGTVNEKGVSFVLVTHKHRLLLTGGAENE